MKGYDILSQLPSRSTSELLDTSKEYRDLITEVVIQLQELADTDEGLQESATIQSDYLQVSASIWHLLEIFVIRPAIERTQKGRHFINLDHFTTIQFAEWLNEHNIELIEEHELNYMVVKAREGNVSPADIWRKVADLLYNAQLLEAGILLRESPVLMYSPQIRSVADNLQKFPPVSQNDMPVPSEYEDKWKEWFLSMRALRRSLPDEILEQFKVLSPMFELFEGSNISDALINLKGIGEGCRPSMSDDSTYESEDESDIDWANLTLCSLLFKQPITQIRPETLDNLFRDCLVTTGSEDWFLHTFLQCMQRDDSKPLLALADNNQRWCAAHLLELLHKLGHSNELYSQNHPLWGTRLNHGLLLDVAEGLLSMPLKPPVDDSDLDLLEDAETRELQPVLKVPALYALYVDKNIADSLYARMLLSQLSYMDDKECDLLYNFLDSIGFEESESVLAKVMLREAFQALYRVKTSENGFSNWITAFVGYRRSSNEDSVIATLQRVVIWGNRTDDSWIFELCSLLFDFVSYLHKTSRYAGYADDIWCVYKAISEILPCSAGESALLIGTVKNLLRVINLLAFVEDTEAYLARQLNRTSASFGNSDLDEQNKIYQQRKLEISCILHDTFLGVGRSGIHQSSVDTAPFGLSAVPILRSELFPEKASQLMDEDSHGFAPVFPVLRGHIDWTIAVDMLYSNSNLFDTADPVCPPQVVSDLLSAMQQLKIHPDGVPRDTAAKIDAIRSRLIKYHPYAILSHASSGTGDSNPYSLVPVEIAVSNTGNNQNASAITLTRSHKVDTASVIASGMKRRHQETPIQRSIAKAQTPSQSMGNALPSPPTFLPQTPAQQRSRRTGGRGTLTRDLYRFASPPTVISGHFT